MESQLRDEFYANNDQVHQIYRRGPKDQINEFRCYGAGGRSEAGV